MNDKLDRQITWLDVKWESWKGTVCEEDGIPYRDAAQSLRLLRDVLVEAKNIYAWAEPITELQQADLLMLHDALTKYQEWEDA